MAVTNAVQVEFPAYIALTYLFTMVNAKYVPRFYHIHRRSGAKIVAASASGHLEVKNVQKSTCAWDRPETPLGELTALPPQTNGGEWARTPASEPHPDSAHHLPFHGKKILRASTVSIRRL